MNVQKSICAGFLVACGLSAQNGSTLIDFGYGTTDEKYVTTAVGISFLESSDSYAWGITRASDGTKKFTFKAENCVVTTFVQAGTLVLAGVVGEAPVCTQLSQSDAMLISPVANALVEFYSLAPEARHVIDYLASSRPFRRNAILTPAKPLNPEMLLFNGFTYDFIRYDLSTNKIKTSVELAPQARFSAVRPTSIDLNEVWVGHGGLINQISVVDMSAGKVLSTIPTTSLDPNNGDPVAMVFTNGGATALYAAAFFKPDGAGNRGALLLINAATRKVISTQLLSFAPSALLVSPDGLTAYLIGENKILYYDVLSGTSDLSASFTFLGPTGAIAVHPDGTRLIFDQGQQLVAFDLSTRKIIFQAKYNLPKNALATSVRMAQDGSKVFVTDGVGNLVVLDTRYGVNMGTFAIDPNTTQILPAPVVH